MRDQWQQNGDVSSLHQLLFSRGARPASAALQAALFEALAEDAFLPLPERSYCRIALTYRALKDRRINLLQRCRLELTGAGGRSYEERPAASAREEWPAASARGRPLRSPGFNLERPSWHLDPLEMEVIQRNWGTDEGVPDNAESSEPHPGGLLEGAPYGYHVCVLSVSVQTLCVALLQPAREGSARGGLLAADVGRDPPVIVAATLQPVGLRWRAALLRPQQVTPILPIYSNDMN